MGFGKLKCLVLFSALFVSTFFIKIVHAAIQPGKCPVEAQGTQFFIFDAINNPLDGYEQRALDQIQDAAQKRGLKTVRIQGDDATLSNFKDYYSCPNLQAVFVNIHGEPNKIDFPNNNESLSSSDLASLRDFHEQVPVIFNSCSVFSSSFLQEMEETAHVQKFAGGITELWMPGAFATYSCFWQHVFDKEHPMGMTQALQSCEMANDPTVKGNHAGFVVLNKTLHDGVKLESSHMLTVSTNQDRELQIPLNDSKQFHLKSGEKITQISSQLEKDIPATICTDPFSFLKADGGSIEVRATAEVHPQCMLLGGDETSYGIAGNGSDFFNPIN